MTDEATIRKLGDEFIEAYNTGDLKRIRNIFADDVVDMSAGGPTYTGDAAKEHFLARVAATHASFNPSLVIHIDEIRVAGDWVFQRGRLVVTLVPKHRGEVSYIRQRYLEIYEELRKELGYADYLGALERYRMEKMHDPRFLSVSNWLIDYPFPKRVFPGAHDVVDQCRRWGKAAILSDGDAVFQPRKVQQSGLWRSFAGNVLIFIHKERELDWVEKFYPARHYVMVDDKLRLLQAIKDIWRERVTTVFVQQGHYAADKAANAKYSPADFTVRRIADMLHMKKTDFLPMKRTASHGA